MLSFDSPIDVLVEATCNLRRVNDRGNFKSSPTAFSFIITQISPLCIIVLQLMPSFFTRYSCDRLHYANTSIDQLFRTYSNLKRVGFITTTFTLEEHLHRVYLAFYSPERRPTSTTIPILVPFDEDNVAKIDYTSFASIDLEEFKRIVTELDATKAGVTITNSQIKFLTANKEIILNKGRQCVIGGVPVGNQIQVPITLYPMDFFNNFTSKRLWLFKPNDSSGIVLIAPMGLHAHISCYFPRSYFPPR